MIKRYFKRLKTEFKGYNAGKFGKDVLAGITVAAVALPLALAFGISSGATAAAGLITALIAGVVIGLLSGASYQISGPTGAMAAILCSLVATYQIQGVFIACFYVGCYTSAVRNIQARRTGTVYTHTCYHRLYIGYSNNHCIRSDKQPYGT